MGQESVIPGRDPDMTGPELRTIREQCGLTLADFGDLVGVADKSVRGWETATDLRVPVDVAETARALHLQLLDKKTEILSDFQFAAPGDEVVLKLYRNSHPGLTETDIAVHNAAAGLAFHDLIDDGISVWMVWER